MTKKDAKTIKALIALLGRVNPKEQRPVADMIEKMVAQAESAK